MTASALQTALLEEQDPLRAAENNTGQVHLMCPTVL